MLKAALCKKNAYLQGGAGCVFFRRAIPQRASQKLPMRENKIRAARQRRMIALRARRQYVVVPYAF